MSEDIQKALQDMGARIIAATRLIRTECTCFANIGSVESYKECGVEKYTFIATFDSRTSKQYQARTSHHCIHGIEVPHVLI